MMIPDIHLRSMNNIQLNSSRFDMSGMTYVPSLIYLTDTLICSPGSSRNIPNSLMGDAPLFQTKPKNFRTRTPPPQMPGKFIKI